jgi:hypothetical protein
LSSEKYCGRESASIENQSLRVTVLREGGHIAGILHKPSGVNPLWTPPWHSIEPSEFDAGRYTECGSGDEAKLLSGIMGHNICLDMFGGPSAGEAAAGIGVHGEGPVACYDLKVSGDRIQMSTVFRRTGIGFQRTLELRGTRIEIAESVESFAAFDRPIGWTQHVTFGPPFLENGVTRFEMSATQSKSFDTAFGAHDYIQPGAIFDWPYAPILEGGAVDMRTFNASAHSSAYTAHLMDPANHEAWFSATHPGLGVTLEYRWKRADFPWLGIWEENRSRSQAPWNSRTLTRGMEFGVSPMPESRRQMVERGPLFGERTFGWLPAMSRLEARYSATVIA